MISEEPLQALMERAAQREHVARRRAVLYSLIPVICAGLLLLVISFQIQQATQQLDRANTDLQQKQFALASADVQLTQAGTQLLSSQRQLTGTQQQLVQLEQQLTQTQSFLEQKKLEAAQLQTQLDDLTAQITLTMAFKRFQFSGDDWALTLKAIVGNYYQIDERLAELFLKIDSLWGANTRWSRTGSSPEAGFNSPSFAAYVLHENNLLDVSPSSIHDASQLRAVLPVRRGDPHVGDVVFYEAGYALFYFRDERNEPFVIGMTPRGILALQPDFASPASVGAVIP